MKRKKKNLFIRFLVVAFAGYVIISLISLRVEIYKSKQEARELNRQYENQQIINEEKQKVLDENNDDELIYRTAGEHGYTKHDEQIYIDAAGH